MRWDQQNLAIKESGGPAWLVTFADVIALLLAFFVMLYSTQRIENGNWQALVDSLSQSLQVEQTLESAKPTAEQNAKTLNRQKGAALSYLETLFRALRKTEPALAGVMLQQRENRLFVSFPADLLFAPGQADPIPASRNRIAAIANLLRNVSNRVDIYGHTDPSPVSGHIFESNWELSLARAEAIAGMMKSAGYERRMGAFGLGDSRFGDLRSIKSRSRQLQLARRVDLVIRPVREDRR
ncbi:MAG: OmpA family protein [Alphaproteobacteria bacterium]|nr:OmpA family protein [Alphaproteobacteria bacterium]